MKSPQSHVIHTDVFHSRMFRLRSEVSPTLQSAIRGVRDEVLDGYGEDEVEIATEDSTTLSREVFARLYEGDEVNRVQSPVGRSWERRVHSVLDGNEAFTSLCHGVQGDVDFAALALTDVLNTVMEQVGDLVDEDGDDSGDDSGDGDGSGTPGGPGQGQGTGQGQGQVSGWDLSTDDVLDAALMMTCMKVQKDLDETREALNGLAPGLGAAPQGKSQQDPRRMVLAEKIRTDEQVKDVLRKAGRLHRMHTTFRKTRTEGHTEIVDVERGGDLSRLLPSVWADLDNPDLCDDALIQIMEHKAPQFSLAGEAPLGRGPIVVLRDVSGSMSGSPNNWAAAVCVLSVQVANREHRQVTIGNYNGGIAAAYRLDTRGRSHRRNDRGEWVPMGDVAELVLEVATDDTGGGTVLQNALTWAMDHGDLMEDRADLVVVTDGRAETVSPPVMDRVVQCKDQGLRISGLVINRGSITPVLRQVCDSTVNLDRSGDTARQAAQGVLL